MKHWIALFLTVLLCSHQVQASEKLVLRGLTLKRAEALALRNNQQIQAFGQVVAQGWQRRLQAISPLLPQAENFSQVLKVQSLGAPIYTTNFRMTQEIIAPELWYEAKIGGLEYHSVRWEHAGVVNDVRFEVREAYYKVVLAQETVAVETENIELLTYALDEEQALFEGGEVTIFNINQSKVAVSNAWADYYTSLRELKNSVNELVLVLGYEPGNDVEIEIAEREIPVEDIPELKDKLQTPPQAVPQITKKHRGVWGQRTPTEPLFHTADMTPWQQLARRRRPDIQRQHVDIQAARRKVQARRSMYSPSLRFFANWTATSAAASISSTPGGTSALKNRFAWDGGLVLTWKLFDGLSRERRISEARAARAESYIVLEDLLQRSARDISNRFNELEENILTYHASVESVQLAEQSIEEAKSRHELGFITPLEFRDAVTSLSKAKNNRNRASYNLLISYYALRRDSGVDAMEG